MGEVKMQRDAATFAARDIWDDCLDRRGIKQEFWQVKESVRKEIISEWTSIIRERLAADPVRTQALELVESLADALGTHRTTRPDDELIANAREFVRKAREAINP